MNKKVALSLTLGSLLLLSPEGMAATKNTSNRKTDQRQRQVKPKKNASPKWTEEELKERINLAQVYFSKGYRLHTALELIKDIQQLELLDEAKIPEALLKMVNSPFLFKADRKSALETLFKWAYGEHEVSQTILAELIELGEELRSPSISEIILTELFSNADNMDEKSKVKLERLQESIIKDISLIASKQKFQHRQHLIALNALDKTADGNNNKTLIDTFESAIKNLYPQSIRLEMLKTFERLTLQGYDPKSHFSRLETKEIAEHLQQWLKYMNEKSDSRSEFTELDIEEAKSILAIAENLLSSPELDKDRNDLLNPMVELLKTRQPEISKLAGEGLINAKIIEVELKLTGLDLGPIFITNSKQRLSELLEVKGMLEMLMEQNEDAEEDPRLIMASKAHEASLEMNRSALEHVASYAAVLIRASFKMPQQQLAPTFDYLKDQFFEQQDLTSKNLALQAFQILDLDLVKSRTFPAAALKALSQMMDNCFQVLDIELEEDNPQLDELKQNISTMLSECTGASLGLDADKWKAWKAGPQGKSFFMKMR